MTRTRKTREKVYPNRFTVRATKDERHRLMKRAKEAHLSLSRFLVECGLSKDAPSWEDKQRQDERCQERKRRAVWGTNGPARAGRLASTYP